MNKKKNNSKNSGISTLNIWLAVIAAVLMSILLYNGLLWIDGSIGPTTNNEFVSETSRVDNGDVVVFALVLGALILGPGILVALIVLPIIRKNKKR